MPYEPVIGFEIHAQVKTALQDVLRLPEPLRRRACDDTGGSHVDLRVNGRGVSRRMDRVPQRIRDAYEIREWRHALAILREDFPEEWNDLIMVLEGFSLPRSSILTPGG